MKHLITILLCSLVLIMQTKALGHPLAFTTKLSCQLKHFLSPVKVNEGTTPLAMYK